MMLRSIFRWIGQIHWIRFGIRDQLLRTLYNPDTASPQMFKVDFFGKIYVGDFSNFIDWSVYYYGAYNGEELQLMQDAVKGIEDPVIFDIGANVGHHTLFASTIAKEVHAFEPLLAVNEKISEKMRLNSIDNVIIHPIGLGNTNENLPYTLPQSINTGTGSFVNASLHEGNTILLPIRVGDEYMIKYKLPKPDFIKMDIEGFEPQALQGLKYTLELYRPIVFFEWSAGGRELKNTPACLFPSQYEIYAFISEQPILEVFNKKNYELLLEEEPYSDGNKVALPKEYKNKLSNRFTKIKG